MPHAVLEHDNFAALSPFAVKLLCDLLAQYRGSNNGDLQATFKLMRRRGWRSKTTLHKAIRELVQSGFVIVSRQGGRHKCSLYAVSFYAIDECEGKHDIAETRTAPGDWKTESVPHEVDQCAP